MENQKEIFINKQTELSHKIKVGSFLVLSGVVLMSLAKSHPNFGVMVEGLAGGLAGAIMCKNIMSLKAKKEDDKNVAPDIYIKLKKDVKLSAFSVIGVVVGLQMGVMSGVTTPSFMFSSYISLIGLSLLQRRSQLAFDGLKENKKDKALNNMSKMRDFYTKEDKSDNLLKY